MFAFTIYSLLITLASLPLVLATPLLPKPNRTIRYPTSVPNIGPGFDVQQVNQIYDAFEDAMELASLIRDPVMAPIVDQIFP